jgi:hypothetical protein
VPRSVKDGLSARRLEAQARAAVIELGPDPELPEGMTVRRDGAFPCMTGVPYSQGMHPRGRGCDWAVRACRLCRGSACLPVHVLCVRSAVP